MKLFSSDLKEHSCILTLCIVQGITLLQDAGTSDDSGRASERLTGSSVAPRDPDSSRDRLSDVSTIYFVTPWPCNKYLCT